MGMYWQPCQADDDCNEKDPHMICVPKSRGPSYGNW